MSKKECLQFPIMLPLMAVAVFCINDYRHHE